MDFSEFGAKPAATGALDFSEFGAKSAETRTPDQQVADADAGRLSSLREGVSGLAESAGQAIHENAGKIIGASLIAGEGAAAGAVAGAPLGPYGALIGGAAGLISTAFIGGASGQAATEAVDAFVDAVAPGIPKKINDRISDIPGGTPAKTALVGKEGAAKPKTPSQVVASVADAGASMARAEVLGKAAGGLIGEGAQAFNGYVKGRAPELSNIINSAMSMDIMPSITQITQSKIAARIGEALSKIPFIGRKIVADRAKQEATYLAASSRILEESGPAAGSLPSVGTKTYKYVSDHLKEKLAEREALLAEQQTKIFRSHGPNSPEYRVLGEQLGAVRKEALDLSRDEGHKVAYKAFNDSIAPAENKVYPDHMVGRLKDLEKEFKQTELELPVDMWKRINYYKNGPGGHVVDDAGNAVPLGDAQPLVDSVYGSEATKAVAERKAYTFQEMSNIISGLNDEIQRQTLVNGPFNKAASGSTTNAGRLLWDIKEAAIKDFQVASDALPAAPKALKDAADAMYREHMGKFFNDDVVALARAAEKNPGAVFGLFARPKFGQQIEHLKEAVGEKGMEPFRRKLVDTLVTDGEGNLLSGDKMMKNLSREGWDETLKAALTPEQYSDLRSSAKELRLPKFMETRVEEVLRDVIEAGGKDLPPSRIVENVLKADEVTLKALRQVVGPEGMKPYLRIALEKGLEAPPAAVTLTGGPALPPEHQMAETLKAYGNTMRYLAPPKLLEDLEKLGHARSLLETEARLSSKATDMASTLVTTAGGIADVGLIFTHPALGVPITVGAGLLSRAYSSDVGRKLFLEGMSAGSVKNAQLAAKLGAYLLNLKKQEYNEQVLAAGQPTEQPKEPAKKAAAAKPPALPPPSMLPQAFPTAPNVGDISPEARKVLGHNF